MPIYEYRCDHCGDFEEMQRITDAPLARCPRCRRKVRRLISQTSFQLKGSGWYVTDYGKGGDGGKKKEAGGDGATTTEAKPADKAESKADTKPAGTTNASSGT